MFTGLESFHLGHNQPSGRRTDFKNAFSFGSSLRLASPLSQFCVSPSDICSPSPLMF
jgi:hypothetical protein